MISAEVASGVHNIAKIIAFHDNSRANIACNESSLQFSLISLECN